MPSANGSACSLMTRTAIQTSAKSTVIARLAPRASNRVEAGAYQRRRRSRWPAG